MDQVSLVSPHVYPLFNEYSSTHLLNLPLLRPRMQTDLKTRLISSGWTDQARSQAEQMVRQQRRHVSVETDAAGLNPLQAWATSEWFDI